MYVLVALYIEMTKTQTNMLENYKPGKHGLNLVQVPDLYYENKIPGAVCTTDEFSMSDDITELWTMTGGRISSDYINCPDGFQIIKGDY